VESLVESEVNAAFESCILVDRSNLSRLRATGPDLLGLLHRLSTGDVAGIAPGKGAPTVLTTAKGRIVERLFVHHLGDSGVLMVGGTGTGERVVAHLARYTFSEDTGLSDVTDSLAQLAILGPRSGEVLDALGVPRPAAHDVAEHEVDGTAVHVLGEDGSSHDGFSIVVDRNDTAAVWRNLAAAVDRCDGRPAGDEAAEIWRVMRGLPASGHELTEDYNPLEAGLWDAVSFDKGCYVGQEVVARLRTYDKVSRSLIGLHLTEGLSLPDPGSALYVEERLVGTLTSAVGPAGVDHPVALAYVKRKEIRPDLQLRIGAPDSESTARAVELPFR